MRQFSHSNQWTSLHLSRSYNSPLLFLIISSLLLALSFWWLLSLKLKWWKQGVNSLTRWKQILPPPLPSADQYPMSPNPNEWYLTNNQWSPFDYVYLSLCIYLRPQYSLFDSIWFCQITPLERFFFSFQKLCCL